MIPELNTKEILPLSDKRDMISIGIKLGLIINLFLVVVAKATMFLPIPFERQIESNDLFVFGEVLSQKGVVLDNKIYTKYLFQIDQFVSKNNLYQSQLYADIFYFYVIGGDYGGKSIFVHGAPKFAVEEKVGLLLKRSNNKYFLSSLALGKYNFIKNHHGRYFSNEVFPYDSHLGQIEYLTFMKRVKESYKSSLHFKKHRLQKSLKIKKFVANKFLQSRSIASKKNNNAIRLVRSNEDIHIEKIGYHHSRKSSQSKAWYIISFFLLLIVSMFLRKIYHEE